MKREKDLHSVVKRKHSEIAHGNIIRKKQQGSQGCSTGSIYYLIIERVFKQMGVLRRKGTLVFCTFKEMFWKIETRSRNKQQSRDKRKNIGGYS